MKISAIFAAVLALAGAPAVHAVSVLDLGAYTLSYDDTTPGFGGLAYSFNGGGGSTGFGWSVQPSVLVSSGGAPAAASFAMPDFTVTVKPGWALSGPVTGSLGNLVFNEVLGATTSATASAMVSVDGGPSAPIGGPLSKVVTTSVPGFLSAGYYAGSITVPVGGFSSFGVSGGSLALTAGGGTFSSVIGQTQNELKFSLIATPVPEPETVALLLAGLLTLGSLAYRRNRG